MKFPTSIWKWQHRRQSIWRTWCYFEAQDMRLTTWRTWCYFEAQVWKKDSSIVPFYFSFFGPSFFGLSFFTFLFFPFFSWDNALIMMIITLLLITTYELQLKTRTRYDSIWMPPAVYRDMQWIKSDMYERIMNGGFATNTMSTTWSCNGNMTKVMYVMMMMMEVAWQYISEWLWKCHNR